MIQVPVANGQLAATKTAIVDTTTTAFQNGQNLPPGATAMVLSINLRNISGSSTETVLLSVLRNGSSVSRQLARYVMVANYTAVYSGFVLGPGDILYGQATDGTTVDFDITQIEGTNSLSIYMLDGTGSQVLVTNNSVPAGNLAVAGTLTVTSTSANAAAIGANGATHPALNVDASASSAATGLDIVSNTAGSGLALQVITSGTNEALTIDAAAAALITLAGAAATATGVQVGSSTSAANVKFTVYSSNATALLVGPNGSTNPTLTVVSGSTFKTGLSLTGAAGGSGYAVAVTSNATNDALTIDAKGSGIVTIASVSTGGCNVRVPVQTVAGSGTTISNAQAVVEGFTYVTAANNATNCVKLPAGAVGMAVTLVNTVQTATLGVFPQVNNAINNLANNAIYNIPNGGKRTFTYGVAGQWYTDPQTIL